MNERTLITVETLTRVSNELSKDSLAFSRRFREDEPLLHHVLHASIAGIIGGLVLTGTKGRLARQLAFDITKLAILAATAMREGYRELLMDMMPSDEPSQPASDPPPDLEKGDDDDGTSCCK